MNRWPQTLLGYVSLLALAFGLLAGCSSNSVTPSQQANETKSSDEPIDKPGDEPGDKPGDADSASAKPVQQPKSTGSSKPMGKMGNMKMMSMPSNPADITFKDSVESNVEVPDALSKVTFLDMDGNQVKLNSYLGKKNVVLVFTEGFNGGMLCPFCKTQTSRLVANYEKFRERDTEVLVVYPGSRDHLDEFVEAAKKTEKEEVDSVPFPLVLDEDLKAVGFFNIASNLAHPSTFIINKKGDIQLAYVGADMSADRPSVSAMLSILDESAK